MSDDIIRDFQDCDLGMGKLATKKKNQFTS